jgi:protein-S-isoprenylcysteine O-methyltransferase Ste14
MLEAALVLPVISVVVVCAARMFELRTRRQTVSGIVKENLTLRLFLLTGFLMLGGGIAEFFLAKKSLFLPTYSAGLICAAFSFFLRRRAIAALGKFWSLHVEIRENHEFVRSGPFRWMRHPTYFSMILELVAIGLMLNAWWTLLFVVLLFIPVLAARVKLEETALIEKFGETYRRYQRTTPAIFPIKIPVKSSGDETSNNSSQLAPRPSK